MEFLIEEYFSSQPIKVTKTISTKRITVATLVDDQCNPVSVGFSFCGNKDRESEQRGIEIAKGRALKQLNRGIINYESHD